MSERDVEKLGIAIRNAAVELGVCKSNVSLTGPQLLMLIDDIKTLAARQSSEAEPVARVIEKRLGDGAMIECLKPVALGASLYDKPPAREAEPDWSESETPAGEVWKNPLFPLSERLQFADGEIAFQRKVVKNLRLKLQEQPPARVPEQLHKMLERICEMQAENYGHPMDTYMALLDLCDEARALLTHLPSETKGPIAERVPKVCDGKEQEAFEAYAKEAGHKMSIHPLHYLFLDPKTNAARMAWRAAIQYCRDALLKQEGGTNG